MKFFRRRSAGPMSCAQVAELLQTYLDGELDTMRTSALHAHLEDCVRCGLEAAAYERIKACLALRGAIEDDGSLVRLRQFAAQLIGHHPGTTH